MVERAYRVGLLPPDIRTLSLAILSRLIKQREIAQFNNSVLTGWYAAKFSRAADLPDSPQQFMLGGPPEKVMTAEEQEAEKRRVAKEVWGIDLDGKK